ncbi:uncharacterized protein LOC135945163 [Cloeon dipterum]|uniref:uncharacterized protein LOC135945163 n=1 Tax=Cloeon dipterum TaxID=197152 RepID=UPI00321FEB83
MAFLLPATVCGTAVLINFITFYYHAIQFGTMVAVTCICLFVILPLTLLNSMIRLRPLAQLLANPERAHETPGGDRFLLNNMKLQAALEVELLRRLKRAEMESLRTQKRAEILRARRKLVYT